MRHLRPVLAFLLFAACLLAQTTYYIDPAGGRDANSGKSVDAPWKTFANLSAAGGTFNGGDSILLLRGTTSVGPLGLTSQGDFSGSNRWLTIGSYGTGARPIITGDASFGGVLLANTGGIRVTGIEVNGGSYGVTWLGSAFINGYGILVDDCVCHGQSLDGINIGANITNNAGSASTIYAVRNCVVYDCNNDGISQTDGMPNMSWEFSGNLVYEIGVGAGSPPVNSASGDGITGHSAGWGHKVFGNVVHDVIDAMHFVCHGTVGTFEVYRNWCYANTGSGIRFENSNAAAATSTTPRVLRIYDNILTMAESTAALALIAVGPEVSGSPKNNYPVNCLIANNTLRMAMTVTVCFGLDLQSSVDSLSVFEVRNNASITTNGALGKHVNIRQDGGTPTTRFGPNRYEGDNAVAFKVDATNYAFAAFPPEIGTASALGTIAIVGDPATAAANAAPTSNSTLVSKGTNLTNAFAIDYRGSARPSGGAWDIGAIQFALRTALAGSGKRTSLNCATVLTADVVSTVSFVLPVIRLEIQYSGITVDSELRIASIDAAAPTTTFDAEEEGVVRLLSATGDFGLLLPTINLDAPTYSFRLLADEACTVYITGYTY